jgi:hypothetical protein
MKKSWSFLITGGDPFQVQVGTNFPIRHNGDRTVWNGLLTEEEKADLEKWLRASTCSCTIYNTDPTESEIDQQLFERTPNDFHCSQCPSCFWYDLSSGNRCKAMDIPQSIMRVLIEDDSAVQSIDYHSCPILIKEE